MEGVDGVEGVDVPLEIVASGVELLVVPVLPVALVVPVAVVVDVAAGVAGTLPLPPGLTKIPFA